ncbi:methionyl-tRNA formyltransferase [Microscilla marina]|uniref:Bifunctional polymyxin resistance ArnA protein n=1 Tax=Microscilla marina ATCC 23134 TaxID=313606 RepID=A1ZI97_MICM2|nr:methionyl-tRNA formyltransferase [Microscilla marina]EAY29765.1 bifunctional polymyxin resistance ArnA protein [Microscilla marina ATCC 23134]
MKIIFLGATQFSQEIFLHLLENNIKIHTVFTIPQEFKISYSSSKVKNYNYANLQEIAQEHNVNTIEIESTKDNRISDHYDYIKEMEPDLILVMGWYYMVPEKIRNLAKYGTWGIHASMLPDYAGGAPLVWAIINGEEETGVSLFKLDNGVDDGDLIRQKSFIITFEDTIKEVYAKATIASKEILLDALQNIQDIQFIPQDKSKIQVFPQRSPKDGEIDFQKPAYEIYNFIRAQSSPYPGAFFKTIDGKKIIIESARIEEL